MLETCLLLQVYERHRIFERGVTTVTDTPCSAWPQMVTVPHIATAVKYWNEDKYVTDNEVADIVSLSHESEH